MKFEDEDGWEKWKHYRLLLPGGGAPETNISTTIIVCFCTFFQRVHYFLIYVVGFDVRF